MLLHEDLKKHNWRKLVVRETSLRGFVGPRDEFGNKGRGRGGGTKGKGLRPQATHDERGRPKQNLPRLRRTSHQRWLQHVAQR